MKHALDNCTYSMSLSHHDLTLPATQRGKQVVECVEGEGKEEGDRLTPPVPRQDLPVAITSIVASGGA